MSNVLRFTASRRFGTMSPLRYPGGKAALAGLFKDVIEKLDMSSCTYVEPYAGGAGAGIALLREGIVDRLVINDIDPAVHAFWTTIVEDNTDFTDWIDKVPLTIDEWLRQRDVYRSSDPERRDLGRAFFYLNRTNRSGVLNAGVIGGQKQLGNYKIDARFNRTTLKSRVAEIGRLAEAITVSEDDGRSVIRQYGQDTNAFLYIDPPYVEAGSQLYLNAFDGADHAALARVVSDIDGANWIMTYDVTSLTKRLYAGHFQCVLDLNYSARYPGRAEELMVASPQVAAALRGVSPTELAGAGA